MQLLLQLCIHLGTRRAGWPGRELVHRGTDVVVARARRQIGLLRGRVRVRTVRHPGRFSTRLPQNPEVAPATALTASVRFMQAHKTTTTSVYSPARAWFIPARYGAISQAPEQHAARLPDRTAGRLGGQPRGRPRQITVGRCLRRRPAAPGQPAVSASVRRSAIPGWPPFPCVPWPRGGTVHRSWSAPACTGCRTSRPDGLPAVRRP